MEQVPEKQLGFLGPVRSERSRLIINPRIAECCHRRYQNDATAFYFEGRAVLAGHFRIRWTPSPLARCEGGVEPSRLEQDASESLGVVRPCRFERLLARASIAREE